MDPSDISAVLSAHPQGTVISAWVVPGASKTQVVGPHGTALRIRVGAPPEDGRANQAVIGELRRLLGIRVDLLSGATSRRKRLLARGMSPDDVVSAILAATTPR